MRSVLKLSPCISIVYTDTVSIGLQWHVAWCIHTILVYCCNKQASHVHLSIQFDTNVSQLLRHVLSWCCDPLPYLGELSWSRLNRLSVCLSCLFWLCIPPAVYGRHILWLRCLRVAPFSEKFFFSIFFPKKWTPAIKKTKKTVLVSPDVSLTSVVIRQLHLTWQLTSVLDNYGTARCVRRPVSIGVKLLCDLSINFVLKVTIKWGDVYIFGIPGRILNR